MFTGIIQKLGKVEANRNGWLRIRAALGRLPLGTSVAINGVCLTVVKRTGSSFEFDMSAETLERTNLGKLIKGSAVNLELPLKPTGMIGGHIVSGHVDACSEIQEVEEYQDCSVRMRIAMPQSLAALIAEKGSIAVDGVSLTVTRVGAGFFETVLIPHTIRHTNLGAKQAGNTVNLEADLLARYVAAALKHERPRPS